MLHHIEIYVSDLNRTKEFWAWLLETELGYTSYQEWDKGQSWIKDGTYVVFVQAEDKYMDVPYHRCRVGLNHLAFHGTSKEHVDRLTQKLRDKGIQVLYQDKHPYAGGSEHYAVYFEDPDRIKVEIIAPKDE